MKFSSSILILSLCSASVNTAMAYSMQKPTAAANDISVSRKSFLGTCAASFVAVSSSAIAPVFAEESAPTTFEDDLAMPDEEEVRKQTEAEKAERLKRKSELQKQKSRPMDFKESMQNEKDRQNSLVKTKEERRNALCEELGRGC